MLWGSGPDQLQIALASTTATYWPRTGQISCPVRDLALFVMCIPGHARFGLHWFRPIAPTQLIRRGYIPQNAQAFKVSVSCLLRATTRPTAKSQKLSHNQLFLDVLGKVKHHLFLCGLGQRFSLFLPQATCPCDGQVCSLLVSPDVTRAYNQGFAFHFSDWGGRGNF